MQRRQLGSGDPPSELAEPAEPVERRTPPLPDLAVEEDRQPEVVTHTPRDRPRHVDCARHIVGRQWHDRHHIGHPDPGMRARV